MENITLDIDKLIKWADRMNEIMDVSVNKKYDYKILLSHYLYHGIFVGSILHKEVAMNFPLILNDNPNEEHNLYSDYNKVLILSLVLPREFDDYDKDNNKNNPDIVNNIIDDLNKLGIEYDFIVKNFVCGHTFQEKHYEKIFFR